MKDKKYPLFSRFLLVALLFLSIGSFAQTPKRIISLVPSVTKYLYLLDADDLLVGCTSFCLLDKPEDAEVVASAIQVNFEKAIMLKPDLVIASSLTTPETIKTFEKLGIETMYLSYPKSFEDLCSHLVILGEKVSKKSKAEEIVADAKSEIEELKKRVPNTGKKPKIFMQIGANPLFTAVPNTFMQDFIDFAGGENIASDFQIGSITREKVLISNPDVIFILLMGTLSADEKQSWEKYSQLSAVKNKKVFVMDQEKTCSPTPLLFVEALQEMIDHIYSE
ncbi:ABC transporter substrate-binding protein [Sunxiuqinia sp. A32]|uniref:ABC transporter substrate-binding protein n=1 Tax=Sunxiuqinia sp. A32 TaxID=3461496 RepID=UPI004045E541